MKEKPQTLIIIVSLRSQEKKNPAFCVAATGVFFASHMLCGAYTYTSSLSSIQGHTIPSSPKESKIGAHVSQGSEEEKQTKDISWPKDGARQTN